MTEEKRLKRGDVREDGKVFWLYDKSIKSGEWWATPERFAELRCKEQKDLAQYQIDNKERIRERKALHNAKPEVKQRTRERAKLRYGKDPLYKLVQCYRSRTYKALKNIGFTKAYNRTVDMLGCGWEQLRSHLEDQFDEGMTWDNYGSGWHVDHITPIGSTKSSDGVLKLCHYTNLQPLWAKDNLQKSNKILPPKD